VAGLANKEIAGVFRDIEVLMKVLGEDDRRAMTYGRVSRLIEGLEESAADLAAAGELTRIKGIGPAVQGAVAELVDRGTCSLRDDLAQRAGPGVLEILRVPGLGPKRVHTVVSELGVRSVEDLQVAALDGRLAKLKGFGAKTVANVLEGIDFLNRSRGFKRLQDAYTLAKAIAARLGIETPLLAGPLRRGENVVDTFSIVAIGDAQDLPEQAEAIGATLEEDTWVVARRANPGLRVRLVSESQLARAVFEETGPPEHVAAVLARPGTDTDEEEIYTSRGLYYVPPERRHACDGTEPVPRVIETDDIRGIVHTHTTWSDGTLDIGAMAQATEERACDYLAITDHSRAAAYAGGLSIDRLREQSDAIRDLNDCGSSLRVLHGTEVDILPDGSLDYPDDVLAALDFVIASVHSSFGQDPETMTARIIAAVRNPHVNILGHVTGRLLLRRGPYAVDVDAVLQAAAETGTAVELNANPWRLDLDSQFHARAQELGVRVPICPDAHSAQGMDDVVWGVQSARHGGLRAEDVPNTQDVEGFLKAIGR